MKMIKISINIIYKLLLYQIIKIYNLDNEGKNIYKSEIYLL
jgi:hypothetical protein